METVAAARLVVARLLGGSAYWPYGVERLVETCRARGIPLALLPGDDKPDPELAELLHPRRRQLRAAVALSRRGRAGKCREFPALCRLADRSRGTVGRAGAAAARRALLARVAPLPSLADIAAEWRGEGGGSSRSSSTGRWCSRGTRRRSMRWSQALVGAAAAAVADLRAQPQGWRGRGACSRDLFAAAPPAVILNATGFSVAGRRGGDPLAAADCPVLQVVFAGSDEESWRSGTRGLGPRDLAMNVALPEIDGRILSRAVSFKAPLGRDPETEADLVGYRPVADRIDFVADLARNWARLRREAARRSAAIALILANYPNRDGRIGNGVGSRHAGFGDRDPAGAGRGRLPDRRYARGRPKR